MLRKMLKYDIERIVGGMLAFYIIAIVSSVLARIFSLFDSSFCQVMTAILGGATISMVINIVINTVIRLWVRFKNNFYGDESYLFHTLPVEKHTLYNSKILSSLISTGIGIVVSALSLFIAYYSPENMKFIENSFALVSSQLGVSAELLLGLVIGVVFVEVLILIQVGYTGILIGHKFQNARMGFSFLFGAIAYTVVQTVVMLSFGICALIDPEIAQALTTDATQSTAVVVLLIVGLVMYALCVVASYVINQKIFATGVNVE